MVYLKGLELEGRLDDPDGGLYIGDAMQILQKLRACLKAHWPYKPHDRDVRFCEKYAVEALGIASTKYASTTSVPKEP
jgi:hypothetical protein